MKAKKLIIFIDCGDTIIDESSEIRDEKGIVIKASVIPGADVMIRTLVDKGYTFVLVADGEEQSFKNMLKQNNLGKYFSAQICSENVGVCKPSSLMFKSAIDALKLSDKDHNRIVMVGNNLSRDIKGANKIGIKSIFLSWSPRYRKIPINSIEKPDYIINEPLELIDLIEKLNDELEKSKNIII